MVGNMIILGIPNNLEDYIMVDGNEAFKLQQVGFKPKYMDEEVLYFKKNNKILKMIEQIEKKKGGC